MLADEDFICHRAAIVVQTALPVPITTDGIAEIAGRHAANGASVRNGEPGGNVATGTGVTITANIVGNSLISRS